MRATALTSGALLLAVCIGPAAAHPLGSFSVNHFSRLTITPDAVGIHHVVDLAEIPAFQALQFADADGDGRVSDNELAAHGRRLADDVARGLMVLVDGTPAAPLPRAARLTRERTANDTTTLRLEIDLDAPLPGGGAPDGIRRITFENRNDADRIGWRELAVGAAPGVSIFDSAAFASSASDELRTYPAGVDGAPLAERRATLSFTTGVPPAGVEPLRARDGRAAGAAPDRFVRLIATPRLTPAAIALALLLAAGLGGLHALSPGHGKTVVAAYLVGARGTTRHALFLGLTVTLTHTIGVFALGLATLFASHYVLPERLLPALSLGSGIIVLGLGVTLLTRRLRAFGLAAPAGHAHHDHSLDAAVHLHHPHDSHPHDHHDERQDSPGPASAPRHAHGGRPHSHLPPGADHAPITWRSLLALGVSGGIVPCPSALVVLLMAIAAQRIGFGLLLIVAFSTGLAAVLTAIGLAFVYAGRWLTADRPHVGALARVLPAVSALAITGIGVAICADALAQMGAVAALRASFPHVALLSVVPLLGFGFVVGVKHALEADHVAAVSTIVSEHASILRSSLVGGFWGLGHTLSLLLAGAAVMWLRIEIGERTAHWLELGVAVMLIGLGLNGLRKLRHRAPAHWHIHRHGDQAHFHPHGHGAPPAAHHHAIRLGRRPLLVGMVHGLAGSAALMLVVLSTIQSPVVGMAYIAAFGVGSIGGMIGMSAILGLPVYLAAQRFDRASAAVRAGAAVFSLAIGLAMAYEIGVTLQ